MATVEDHVLTPDDLLQRRELRHCELVDGHLVEKSMSGKSVWVGGEVYARLREAVRIADAGVALTDGQGFQCFPFDPSLLRKPDASFVKRGRLPEAQFEKGHIRIAPDIMVEVVSPEDSHYDITRRIDDFLEAGTLLCWMVNPDNRTVTVFRQDGTVDRLGEDAELTGENVLDNFACHVKDLFPPVDLSDLL